jgi:hypothetical protein
MKLSDGVFGLRIRILKLEFVLVATLGVGCVNLNKPSQVQECATAGNCSDDPKHPGPDAKEDTAQHGPDLSNADKPTAKDDVDNPVPDAPADLAEESPNDKDAFSSDGDAGSSPADQADRVSFDADSGPPPADVGPESVRPDTLPDLGPDLPPDLGRDTTPDTNPLLTGLIIYYTCESASGDTLPDSSGKNNNGTLVSASGTTGYSFSSSGKVGKALTLAKAGSGYVSMPPAAFANLTDMTIATWVYVTTSQNWQRIFDIGVNAHLTNNTSTGTHYMNLVPQNGSTSLAFYITQNGYGAEQMLSSGALAAGAWKHVAVVLGSGQGSLYIDGVAVSTNTALSLRPNDLGAIDYAYLGKSQFSADAYFDGKLDEFRVYSRALSAAEIQALFQYTGP